MLLDHLKQARHDAGATNARYLIDQFGLEGAWSAYHEALTSDDDLYDAGFVKTLRETEVDLSGV